MFSFHKPKIYRSLQGCCICRAKSSSSRFTDSKRYEDDFEKCFDILEPRTGEICNACVLLVKRWKKLPSGSTRNWHHVVDARAGPGTKSMNKIKNKAAGIIKEDSLKEERFKKKHKHKHHKKSRVAKLQMEKVNKLKQPASPSTFSDDIGDECLSEDQFSNYDADFVDDECYSNSDVSDDETDSRSITRSTGTDTMSQSQRKRKASNPLRFSSFLDLTYWKKTEICCGIVFKGANGELLLDPSLMRPCRSCNKSPLTVGNSSSGTTSQHIPALDSQASFGICTQPKSTLKNLGGAAMVVDTNPPAPVEVEPIMDDQGPAESPMSAQTTGLLDVEEDNTLLNTTSEGATKLKSGKSSASQVVLDLAAKLPASHLDTSACGRQRQPMRRCLPLKV